MLFNSWEFIFLFVPLTYLGFLVIGRFFGNRLVLSWLVLCSLFFYGWWNPIYLSLIVLSMVFNYSVGMGLVSLNRSLNSGSIDSNFQHRRKLQIKLLLFLGVSAHLLTLAYFKYAGFLSDNLEMLGINWEPGKIVLPLGISFFTFQKIAFLVDAARGEVKSMGIIEYSLFVTFFPQLIAGPIVHHKEMMPQFEKQRYSQYFPSLPQTGTAISIFLMGLLKKVILADGISEYANPVFNAALSGEVLGFYDAWCGALAYTLQLYFDFSGYCDMAVGVALLFGVSLPVNFNSPYKSLNIIDFWRRWHITLSRFLRDYLYIPLGGNRKGLVRKELNLMATMLLGGLWHGASWSFVLWGGLHGGYLMINHLWNYVKKLIALPNLGLLGIILARGITLVAVIVAWVFFRAESLDSGLLILGKMVDFSEAVQLPLLWDSETLNGVLGSIGPQKWYRFFDSFREAYWIFVLFLIVLFFPNTSEIGAKIKATLEDSRIPEAVIYGLIGATAYLLVMLIIINGSKFTNEFIYFNF
ncbi:MAG: MBOAT family O-acyltransferase [Calothrix sp. MO_192.B10]|nr:MBOAT family O-acyltransferase [Calothrix sp. MO_192.B10]